MRGWHIALALVLGAACFGIGLEARGQSDWPDTKVGITGAAPGTGKTLNQALLDGDIPGPTTRSMYWGAGAMEVDGVQCANQIATTLVASGPVPLAIACTDSDLATISGTTTMPDGWDGGTVTFTLIVGQILASTGEYHMDFEGQCIGAGEAFLAWGGGTEQAADITLTADDEMNSATTTPVTLDGSTCAGGDVLAWQGAIDATGSATDLETLAAVLGVRMEFTWNFGD